MKFKQRLTIAIVSGVLLGFNAVKSSAANAYMISEATPTDVFYCQTQNPQAKALFSQAVRLRQQGKLEEAKNLYLKAIELDPKYCDAMDNLGQLLRTQGKIDEAITWYQKSLALSPNNLVAHLNLAVAYSFQGKTSLAVQEYETLIRLAPENAEGYYGLGVIYLNQQKPQQAILQLKIAEEIYAKQSSPLLTDSRYLLGVAHFLVQEWGNARNYFEMIYPEAKDNRRVNFFLGVCYLSEELKNLELARKYINKAKELGLEIPPEIQQQINP